MRFDLGLWLERARELARLFRHAGHKVLSAPRVRTVLYGVKEPVFAVTLVFTATAAVAQPFYVPTGSMQPTIAIGDAVLTTKFDYGYSQASVPFAPGPQTTARLWAAQPAVGDVVVFRKPTTPTVNLVKRVIGVAGDRIQMRDGRLWINGRELPLVSNGSGKDEISPGGLYGGAFFDVARYTETLPNGRQHPIYKWRWDGPLDNTEVFVVPPGKVFVMGDNRDDSSDSRELLSNGGFGFVPLGNIVGKARIVLGSVDYANADGFWEWPAEFRVSRILKTLR